MKTSKWLKTLALTIAASTAVSTTASAQLSALLPPPGGTGMSWFGGDLTIAGVSKDAHDKARLYMFRAGAALPLRAGGELIGEGVLLGDNFSPGLPLGFSLLSWSTALTEATLLGLGYVKGDEIIFGLYNISTPVATGKWNFTGDATRNAPENFFTANTSCVGGWDCSLLMEDRSPGDLDRNDFTIRVTASPEPGTIGLLATGLIGLAGVAARRRRNKA